MTSYKRNNVPSHAPIFVEQLVRTEDIKNNISSRESIDWCWLTSSILSLATRKTKLRTTSSGWGNSPVRLTTLSSVFLSTRGPKVAQTWRKSGGGGGWRHALYKCVYTSWGFFITFEVMNTWLWSIFGCKVVQSVPLAMKPKLDIPCPLLNVCTAYTKFQIDISNHIVWKTIKSGKLRRTEGRTDGRKLVWHNTTVFRTGVSKT